MKWENGVLVSNGSKLRGDRILSGFRIWAPERSKFSAFYHITSGREEGKYELDSSMRVLYLGAGNGTTVSFVSDYVEVVYAVEFAPRPMCDLLDVCKKRGNIIPFMADARQPAEYLPFVEMVDMVYQDVAQPDQAGIALDNCVYLKNGGIYILMLKTRSVSVCNSPEEVCDKAVGTLMSGGLEILDTVWLSPYYPDHAVIICRKPAGFGE